MPSVLCPEFGHITLTVSDLERSAAFYNRVFSAQTSTPRKWRAHLGEQGIDCDGPVSAPAACTCTEGP